MSFAKVICKKLVPHNYFTRIVRACIRIATTKIKSHKHGFGNR